MMCMLASYKKKYGKKSMKKEVGSGVESRLFWAQMALATLVPFKGPKKSRFLGPPPKKNAPIYG